MTSKNLNYFYYVEYFEGLDMLDPAGCENDLLENNRQIAVYSAAKEEMMSPLGEELAPHTIRLITAYPGLLIGTGIAHAFGGKGEAALGLCLDYVTGMPYIPGSSVKGALRSAFDDKEYIRSLLEDAGVKNAGDIDIDEFEERIFGRSVDRKKNKQEKPDIGFGETDRFFDAVVVSGGRILASDTITPHRQNPELLEFDEPNPITMIRIRPGVTILFQFSMKETVLSSGAVISPVVKLSVFKGILTDLGIGAKTNVGYGLLKEPSEKKPEEQDSEPVNNDPCICTICGGKKSPNYPTCSKCAPPRPGAEASSGSRNKIIDRRKSK